MKKISAFILSYNSPDKLEQCVMSLLNQSCIDEIILLDNKSTVRMQDVYSKIQTLCLAGKVNCIVEFTPFQYSYSEGQNWGLDTAKNNLVLLMNNDAYFLQPNSLNSSVAVMENFPKIFLVGHKILDSPTSLNHAGVYNHFDIKSGMHFGYKDDPTRPQYNRAYTGIAMTAACLLVRKSKLRFQPGYWYSCEDIDFSYQHFGAGKHILYNPFCEVLHLESSSREEFEEKSSPHPVWKERQCFGYDLLLSRWRFKLPLFHILSFRQVLLTSNGHRKNFISKLSDYLGVFLGLLLSLLLPPSIWTLLYLAAGFCIGKSLGHLTGYLLQRQITRQPYIFFRNTKYHQFLKSVS